MCESPLGGRRECDSYSVHLCILQATALSDRDARWMSVSRCNHVGKKQTAPGRFLTSLGLTFWIRPSPRTMVCDAIGRHVAVCDPCCCLGPGFYKACDPSEHMLPVPLTW